MLQVRRFNARAIAAYRRAGFRTAPIDTCLPDEAHSQELVTMVLDG